MGKIGAHGKTMLGPRNPSDPARSPSKLTRNPSKQAREIPVPNSASTSEKPARPRGRSPMSSAEHSNIFLGHLALGLGKATIRTLCSTFGHVVACRLLPRARGHECQAAVVKFENRLEAEIALRELTDQGWTARFARRDFTPSSASTSRSSSVQSVRGHRDASLSGQPGHRRVWVPVVPPGGAAEVPIMDEDDELEEDDDNDDNPDN